MTEADRAARARLASAERDLAGRARITLGQTWRRFWHYPSPWMIAAYVVGTVVARVLVGHWAVSDLWAPLVFVALFPFTEWGIHVSILHWRPRKVAGVYVDTLLAREHRRHHADPRDVPLVFIPWRALVWVILLVGLAIPMAVGRLAGASWGGVLTYTMVVSVVLFGYEWTHYLIHSDYRPRTRAYRRIWRNHRLHHYKNEHYWFSITTSGTSDRVLGTHPDPATVRTSRTARDLHGSAV
ncbi:MAG: sterol desaturase family protein [Marmoricola sp.]